MAKLIILLSTHFLFACTTIHSPEFRNDLVKKRATFDLDCADVNIYSLGNSTYGAKGCGKQKTYILVCGGVLRTDSCNAIEDTRK